MIKNTLKIPKFLLFFGTLIFAISCSEDDGTTPPEDTTLPTIVVNAPADGAIVVAGSQVASSISFSDDTEISSVSITVGNGTVTVIDIQETDIGDVSFNFTDNLVIPNDVVLGEHTVTVTVEDTNGNSASASLTIEALPVFTSGQATVLLTEVPSQIADYSNETIYAVGTIQETDWTVDSGSDPLTLYTDSEGTDTYYIQTPDAAEYEFKFVRGLSWDFGQKDADGKESDNSKVAADSDIARFQVGSWKDYNPDVINNSSGTIISIDGTLASTSHTIQGTVTPGITSTVAISTVAYAVTDEDDMEVANGTMDLDANNGYSETLDVSNFGLGTFTIKVTATDANGSMGREDRSLTIVEFPCDDSSLSAVDATMTRVIINVQTNVGSRNMYATGNINGAGVWGTIDDAYKMTQLSDGCYYIDLVLAADDELQFFYEEATHGADWWRGAATRIAGDGGSAGNNVDAASSGNTVKYFYGAWRQDPPN